MYNIIRRSVLAYYTNEQTYLTRAAVTSTKSSPASLYCLWTFACNGLRCYIIMEHLCPQIEQLVRCFTCGSQTLPPYTLCVQAHLSCPTCTEYMSVCACGRRFLQMSNATFDWTMSAMKFRCKYRANGVGGGGSPVSSAPERPVDCADQWYTVQELRDHYLTGCSRNSFACPVRDCGLVARIDTVTDHYETAHGPFESLSPNCSLLDPKCVMFRLLCNKYKWVRVAVASRRFCYTYIAISNPTDIKYNKTLKSNAPRVSSLTVN